MFFIKLKGISCWVPEIVWTPSQQLRTPPSTVVLDKSSNKRHQKMPTPQSWKIDFVCTTQHTFSWELPRQWVRCAVLSWPPQAGLSALVPQSQSVLLANCIVPDDKNCGWWRTETCRDVWESFSAFRTFCFVKSSAFPWKQSYVRKYN